MTLRMKNPSHPGNVVLHDCIKPLGLTITDAAALHVTRSTLSELVNGKRGISPEMAVRLEQVFGGSAESWLAQSKRNMSLRRLSPEFEIAAIADCLAASRKGESGTRWRESTATGESPPQLARVHRNWQALRNAEGLE